MFHSGGKLYRAAGSSPLWQIRIPLHAQTRSKGFYARLDTALRRTFPSPDLRNVSTVRTAASRRVERLRYVAGAAVPQWSNSTTRMQLERTAIEMVAVKCRMRQGVRAPFPTCMCFRGACSVRTSRAQCIALGPDFSGAVGRLDIWG